jgi:tetratricopeptide (TPR) repeat protein
LTTQQTAYAAAQHLGDQRALAHANYQLAQAYACNSDDEHAEQHVSRALELFRSLGDRPSEAVAMHGQALLLERQGRYSEAVPIVLEALRILQATGHWWTQATLENSAGWMYAHLGRYPDALERCQKALSLHRDSGHLGGVADTLDSIGYINLMLGDLAAAKTYYELALETYRDLGEHYGEALSLNGLGDTLSAQGNIHAARTAWSNSVAILDCLSRPDADVGRAKLSRHRSSVDSPSRARAVIYELDDLRNDRSDVSMSGELDAVGKSRISTETSGPEAKEDS